MSYQTKRKLMNGIIYGVLTLTVATVIIVTIVTVSTSTNHPVTPAPTVDAGKTNTPPKDEPPKTELPKITKEPTPSPEPTPTPSPTPTIPSNNDHPILFTLPVNGTVMKEFSIDLPVFSFTMGDWRTHNGIDISVAAGEGVCAAAQGTIKSIKNHPMMGTTIEIDHGGGLISRYSNLDTQMVEGIAEGVSVGGGQLIGSVGFTSLAEIAESDHLHFEIEQDGKPVDPTLFLDFSSVELDSTAID